MLGKYSNLLVPVSEVNRIINEHPSLVQLHLPQYQFQVDDVITLICQVNTIKSLRLRMQNALNYTVLESKIDKNVWMFTKVDDWDSEYVKLNRKK